MSIPESANGGKHSTDSLQGHRNVQIEALCCFDTVGALGVPLFGPARIFQIFRKKHQFHDTNVTPSKYAPRIQTRPRHGLLTCSEIPEVKVNLHACATNEIREPFELTPMHLPNGSTNKPHGSNGSHKYDRDAHTI
jgi:hypothetical protein